LRIALVIERFEPGGGAENVAWAVAHRLADRGEAVRVVARTAHPSARVPVDLARVPRSWQPLRVLAFSAAAARRAPRGSVDVVHSFSRTRHQDVYRAGGGCHAAYLEQAHRRPTGGWRRFTPRHAVLLGMEQRIFADASQLVQCNSALVRDQIRDRFAVPPDRLVVLPNGVDTERFHPRRRAHEGARMRDELGAAEGPVWLLVGSGLRRKGLDTALGAFACTSKPGAELWVAGRDDPTPWRTLARRLGVGERVRFLGPRTDLEAVYAAADALLLPTRYDAFANVCLEAASAGLPVVTSAANGAANALRDGTLVVDDSEDVDGFARALEQLDDPAVRRRLGEAGRSIAETLGWDEHVRRLCDLYARVAP
jgi:UDP-glucose:(heptosyl)LPS alpha-1,3-glucosyltransferase